MGVLHQGDTVNITVNLHDAPDLKRLEAERDIYFDTPHSELVFNVDMIIILPLVMGLLVIGADYRISSHVVTRRFVHQSIQEKVYT